MITELQFSPIDEEYEVAMVALRKDDEWQVHESAMIYDPVTQQVRHTGDQGPVLRVRRKRA